MDEDRISFLQGDFEKARVALDRLTTRETETIRGLPQMLTVQDLQLVFKLDYHPCLRLIRRYIRPLGGTLKLGVRLYIYPWAVNRLLNQVGRCPECGRHWDDELALKELKGELEQSTTPLVSTPGLQGGLKLREEMRALGADVDFEDIKPRMSMFGDPSTCEPEEQPDPVRTYNPEEYWRKLREQGLLAADEELGDER